MEPDGHAQAPLLQLPAHRLSHLPQWFGSQFVSVSQPLSGLLSQSRNDPMHETMEQFPFEHLGTAWFQLHWWSHAPQLSVSVMVSAHHALLPLPQNFGCSAGQF
jgi:hypothetical protein